MECPRCRMPLFLKAQWRSIAKRKTTAFASRNGELKAAAAVVGVLICLRLVSIPGYRRMHTELQRS